MRLPSIRYGSKLHRLEQIRFGGMDRRKNGSDGVVKDMLNISMDEYPCLQTREDRGSQTTNFNNLMYYDSRDHQIVIAGNTKKTAYAAWKSGTSYSKGDIVSYKGKAYKCKIAYNGTATPLGDNTHWEPFEPLNSNPSKEYYYSDLYVDEEAKGMFLSRDEKEVGILNNVAVIVPDMKYYNITEGETGWLKQAQDTTFVSNDYLEEVVYTGSGDHAVTEMFFRVPDRREPIIKAYWNLSGFSSDGYSNVWEVGSKDNFKLSDFFTVGDVVTIKQTDGLYDDDGEIYAGYVALNEEAQYLIKEIDNDSITFDGNPFADAEFSEGSDGADGKNGYNHYVGSVIIKRATTVDFKHMCVSKNRMWACKGDTIYASALGDCLSWTRYSGVGTDPWTTDTGSPGDFTACYEYGGIPLFFKRDCAYAVYGDYYSNFAAQKVMDRGVREDSHKSVCVVNSILMWLSDNGVCAYTGGVPAIVSDELCENLSEGVASTDGFRYYLSASNGKKRRLYVYDTRYGTWTSEDMEEKPAGMSKSEENLSYMKSDGTIMYIKEFGEALHTSDGEQFDSYIEFKDFYEQSMDKKDIGKIIVRASAAPEFGGIDIKIMYDSDGVWQKVGRIYNQSNAKKVSEFGFFPRRCDHWRLRLESKGKFVLYGIARKVRV